MIETRRYRTYEWAVPYLTGEFAEPRYASDLDEITVIRDDIEATGGGGWSVRRANVLEHEVSARPDHGGIRGNLVTVTLSREVQFPAHVWVGYWEDGEFLHVLDGRMCETEEEADRYLDAAKEAKAPAARDLYLALRDVLTETGKLLAAYPSTTENDYQQLRRALNAHTSLVHRYSMTRGWEVRTDGGRTRRPKEAS